MADTKISGLAAGAPAQAGDLIPIARSGANYSITPANILAYGTSPVAGTSGTFSTTLGVTGASTLAALSATTGTFSGAITANAGITSTAGLANPISFTGTNSSYVIAALGNTANTIYLGAGNGTVNGGVIAGSTASAGFVGSTAAYGFDIFTNGTSRISINSAGIVTMPAYGAGAATFSAAGVISSVSDETWKIKDGIPTDPDAMLKKLEPGYWYYNNEKKDTFGKDRQLGFYAQNVNAAIGPEAAPIPETIVTKNEDGTETTTTKPWGYYDRSVLAVTVMALQKALATIEILAAKVAKLEAA